jgi:hypothetical protein
MSDPTAAPATLDALADAAAPATVDEVLDRLGLIVAALPEADGLAAFARVYQRVTDWVGRHLGDATFRDPLFLARLDVVFAGLFLEAVSAWVRRVDTPRAWRPLFDCRGRPGILPLQFVLAGMNAHINRDLPVALVATCEELGRAPRVPSPEHDDFLTVNGLLARAQDEVKGELAGGVIGLADAALGRLDDRVSMWNVERARDAAWIQGQALWALRDLGPLRRAYVDTLDRTVGFAGRGLLLPVT